MALTLHHITKNQQRRSIRGSYLCDQSHCQILYRSNLIHKNAKAREDNPNKPLRSLPGCSRSLLAIIGPCKVRVSPQSSLGLGGWTRTSPVNSYVDDSSVPTTRQSHNNLPSRQQRDVPSHPGIHSSSGVGRDVDPIR